MVRRAGICGVFLPMLLALALGAPAGAAAKPKKITGKLDARDYTVIVLARSGAARTEQASNGKFSLRPPANKVTLHLRASDGTYAGPIVLGKKQGGKSAIVGVRAGADLGKIDVRASRGYAKVKKPPKDAIDENRLARAKKGVPKGAGNFGLVQSKPAKHPPAGDRDFDGVPDPLDVDDDGDKVMDNLEPPRPVVAGAARRGEGQTVAENTLAIGSLLPVPLTGSANASAAGLSTADSDAVMRQFGRLGITSPVGAPELDCGGERNSDAPPAWLGGLGYCTLGGTGSVFATGPPPLEFPECCDADGDGLGTVVHVVGAEDDGIGTPAPAPAGPAGAMTLNTGATRSEIATGDLLVERAGEDAYPVTLQFVFATNPALASYSDTGGDTVVLDYPVLPGEPGSSSANPFPIRAGDDGHVRLTLTFWRPQRQRTEADADQGEWIDIGGLIYTLNTGRFSCPQAAYSSPDLTTAAPGALGYILGPGTGGLVDGPADAAADPGRLLSFTVDVTACAAASGSTLNPGEPLFFALRAVAPAGGLGGGESEQQFWVAVP